MKRAVAAPRALAACAWAGLLSALPLLGTPHARADGSAGTCQAAEDPARQAPATPSCAEAGRQGAQAVAFLWTAPHFALERPGSRAFRYAPHPYADGEPGLLRFGAPGPRLRNPRRAAVPRCRLDPSSPGDPCARRVRTAGQRGELELGAGILQDRTASAYLATRLRTRVRLEASVELLGNLRWQAPGRARSLLGHYTLDYRFAQSERLSLRSGLGGLSQSDASGSRGGGFLDYALQWLPRAPFTLEARAAIGGLAGAFYGRLCVMAGLAWQRLELRLGYDHITLRGRQVTRLSGPRLSLRAWL